MVIDGSLQAVGKPRQESLFERAEGPETSIQICLAGTLGDFNLIYMEHDKSNDSLDKRMTAQFRRTFNQMEVREIQLPGRQFARSNDQNNHTMTRIDRAFCTTTWEELHLDPILLPQSTSTSYHCPLLLHSQEQSPTLAIFRFEEHWPLMPGYLEYVHQAWSEPIANPHNALFDLHIKLPRRAKALTHWARHLIPLGKLASHICREVMGQLDKAQEFRAQTAEEMLLKQQLNNRIMGLAAIEKSRAQQKSRLT
jgi:hypothetical protein